MAERPDEDVASDVRAALSDDGAIEDEGLEVLVEDGTLTLRGHVWTYLEKSLAVERAAHVPGVREVVERVVVRVTGEIPSDLELCAALERALEQHPDVDHARLHARVREGLVVLEGTVGAVWKRHLAERLVATVRGVTGVRNEIAVAPLESAGDEEIAVEVEKAISRAPDVEPDDVEVSVRDGRVSLRGRVPTWGARRSAADAAAHARGARVVENRIVVEG